MNHEVHSPDTLVQNKYGNICSTAAIPVCKGQSDSRSARTYIIMIIIVQEPGGVCVQKWPRHLSPISDSRPPGAHF